MLFDVADDLSQSSYQVSSNSLAKVLSHKIPSAKGASIYIQLNHLLCSAKAIASKIALDQVFMAPIGTTLFYLVTSVLQGETSQVPTKMRDKFVPTLIASYTLWPAAHAINFKFVPSQQRILYTNIVSVSTAICVSSTFGFYT